MRSKKDSAYRKLQRFFQYFALPYEIIARMLINFLPTSPLVISIDRTNWKYCHKDINIFMICANYRGIGIPILWKMLPKKVNSNTTERTELLCLFIDLFGKGRIKYLLADREFIGEQWFGFYLKNASLLHQNQKQHSGGILQWKDKKSLSPFLTNSKVGEQASNWEKISST